MHSNRYSLLLTDVSFSLFLFFLTALTSPVDYQRNHVGGSVSAPIGSSASTGGQGGARGGGGGMIPVPVAPGCRSRPSRIPQPSRLPQPLRHHSPALGPGAGEPDGPNKISGMPPRPLPSCTTDPDTTRDSAKLKLSDSPQAKRSEPVEDVPKENQDMSAPVQIPRATVAPLSLAKPRPGTISPVGTPLATPGFKDFLAPCSPGPKNGGSATPSSSACFWSSMPGSPAGRPGSFTFPGEAGEPPSRPNQNQNHRHSSHSKDADRMSTCSSASEQSVQSTQSNGVRALLQLCFFAAQPQQLSSTRFCCFFFFVPLSLVYSSTY